MVVVADGTELAAQKLERVLTTDPGMGVLRHVDAGYERAVEVARERGVHVPMLDGLSGRPASGRGGHLGRRRRRSSSTGSGIVTMWRTLMTARRAGTRAARRSRPPRSSRGGR